MIVVNAGFKSKLVDLGRKGLQYIGYCESGPADLNSYKLANMLLKKSPDAVAIEVMFGGFELKVEQNMLVCLTGADCDFFVDNMQYQRNQVVNIKAGETLRIGTPRVGLYSYLAFSHDLVSPLHFGSVCAVHRERLGGSENNGLGLQTQQVLYTLNNHDECTKSASDERLDQLSQADLDSLVTPISEETSLRYVPAYQYSDFSHTQVALFEGQQHEVTHHISSMGVKLQGLPNNIGKVTMYSEGICKGAIQITPNGQAIVMLHERQTIGGYPKIGSVISADIPMLAQCQAGTKIQFVECDIHTAREALLLRHERFKRCFA